MKSNYFKKNTMRYWPVILLTLLWLGDTLMDMVLFGTGGRYTLLLGQGQAPFMHLLVFAVQFAFVVYVWKAVRDTISLKDSLEAVRCRAEEQTAKMESMMEAMVDPVSVQDSGFTIVYQNQAHREMMGDHVGKPCYQAYMGRDAVCDDCHVLKTFSTGLPHSKEVALELKSGLLYAEIAASPLKDASGNVTAAIEVIRDITSRKNCEYEIRKLNADLEQRALDLVAGYRELEAFSYSVSHDLRTPLTRIYCAGQALAEGYRERLDGNGSFFVRTICDASEQMEGLIDALMSLSQVTRSSINTQEVDLVPLALEIVANLRQTEPGRHVKFLAPPELKVTGDVQLLRVLLENLLGNAWKYTRKSHPARIELGVDGADGAAVYSVRDNGAGFDMKDADRMFKPFNRLHKSDDFPGTGIGLATVQRIIQRHGGEVWAEGEPGNGACFYFTLK